LVMLFFPFKWFLRAYQRTAYALSCPYIVSERAKQPVSPFQGLTIILPYFPGWKSTLPRALPPWALLSRDFSAHVP
jgi:hypothetical protein